MISRATGLFTIYRGTAENASGDELAADYLIDTAVPLGLRNAALQEDPPNSNVPRTIAGVLGRAPAGTDIQAEDRIEDEQGLRYVIDAVRPPLSSTRNADLSFTAHRVM